MKSAKAPFMATVPTANTIPVDEATARAQIEEALRTLEQLKRETLDAQDETDRLGRQIDARLARIKQSLAR